MLWAPRRSIPWIGVLASPHTMALGVLYRSVASAASKGQEAAESLLNASATLSQPDRYLELGA